MCLHWQGELVFMSVSVQLNTMRLRYDCVVKVNYLFQWIPIFVCETELITVGIQDLITETVYSSQFLTCM